MSFLNKKHQLYKTVEDGDLRAICFALPLPYTLPTSPPHVPCTHSSDGSLTASQANSPQTDNQSRKRLNLMHPDVTFPVLLLRHSRQPEQSRLTVLSSFLTEIDEREGSWAAGMLPDEKRGRVTLRGGFATDDSYLRGQKSLVLCSQSA
ncbi:hypothetical protein CDAR_97021 [Caerostris darwini]|uniref:Uncharacterized protein n=1 Tax=Caerostris darwini TaxID=1538125 RepID=A0AAV4QLX7_9ARAC|nr:hypothetical protein CDAR_97021 [Caerostris darwini]